MPWLTLWADPVCFTRHRGVTIYHTYNGVDARGGFRRFHFTTSEDDGDPRFHFDVRELPVSGAMCLRDLCPDAGAESEHAIIRETIHEAIDCGLLRQDEISGGPGLAFRTIQ